MYKKSFIIFILIFGISLAAYGQKKAEKLQKIGCVDVREVFEQIPQAINAQQQLENKQKEIEKIKEEQQKELNAMLSEATNMKSPLRSLDALELNRRMTAKRREMSEFAERSAKELAELEEKLLQPVFSKLQSVVKEIAQKNGLSMVIDRVSVIYVEKEYDITQNVIEEMKKAEKEENMEKIHD